MDDVIEVLSARFGGLVPARALREAGVADHTAESMVRRGVLVPIRHGVYADARLARGADSATKYRMLVRATTLTAKRPMVLSDLSAAVVHGLPLIGQWPATTHVIDTKAAGGSSSRHVTSHRGGPEPAVMRVGEVTLTSLPRTLIDVALRCSFLVAVTMIDHALRVEQQRVADEERHGLRGAPALTKDDLYAELATLAPTAGAKRAERAIGFANPLSANPGETLSRVRIFELGFEVPELQVHFDVKEGDYWVDYFWRGVRKIGEFDGDHKYTRGAILGDRDPAEVMLAEKRREDILRQYVTSFCRWDWHTAISARLFYAFLIEHGVPRA